MILPLAILFKVFFTLLKIDSYSFQPVSPPSHSSQLPQLPLFSRPTSLCFCFRNNKPSREDIQTGQTRFNKIWQNQEALLLLLPKCSPLYTCLSDPKMLDVLGPAFVLFPCPGVPVNKGIYKMNQMWIAN